MTHQEWCPRVNYYGYCPCEWMARAEAAEAAMAPHGAHCFADVEAERQKREAAEAKLAEAVRLLGSLFSVFGHSGLEPKYPSLTRQVSDLLASIDNDPAKHNHVAPLKSRQPPEVTRPPAQESPVGLGASRDPGTGSGTRPGDSPSGVSPSPPECTLCEKEAVGLWMSSPLCRFHLNLTIGANPDTKHLAHDFKPTRRPPAETMEKC